MVQKQKGGCGLAAGLGALGSLPVCWRFSRIVFRNVQFADQINIVNKWSKRPPCARVCGGRAQTKQTNSPPAPLNKKCEGIISRMKADWYIILFFLLAFVMIGLNELGYGVFALPLLFPASWLLTKAFEQENPNAANTLMHH